MKKKILMLVMAFAIILPAAFLLSACGGKNNPPEVTETGISVYIDGTEVNEQFNTIEIDYGDYTDISAMINRKLSVVVNYSDETNNNLVYGDGGYAISGLPQNLNANEQGYNLTLTYKNFDKDLILVIRKANLDFSNVYWNYDGSYPFTYDGKEKTVSIINLPDGVTVNYTGTRSATNAGTYTAGVEFEYDDENYYLSGAPQELEWKIEKAENTISGELVLNDITYGDTLGEPSGVSALHGEMTYKYYNSEKEEISKPTNVGTYYVKGFSVGNDNWVAQETEYKQFYISRNYISDPELVRNSFIYTGTAFTPELVEEIDESIVEMTGYLSGTETGNYTITFTLKDKTNYGWQSAFETAQATNDITLNWSIIDSPLTMTLNDKALSSSEFEARTQVEIGDKWQVSVSEGYNYSLDYEYLNESGNKVWSYGTNEGLNGNLTVSPSHLTYVIKITQNAEVVYTKTITVNHDIFENVMVGEVAMTFDEFVANPEVEYGKNLKFNLKTEYLDTFNFSQNNFTVTNNTTVTITYQILDTRVYKTIEVLCVIDPVESVEIGSQTLSYEDFIANPVVKYGDTLSINFKSNYTGFDADCSFPYEVKDDIKVTIYTSTDEIFDTINVKCRKNVLTNISIDGTSVSYEELLQMNSIHLGSSLTFTINEEFVNVIEVVINNNGQDNVLTGQQTIVFEEINNFYLNIRDKYTQNYINSISLNVIFFDNIEINNKMVNTSSTYVEYSRDLGENNFVISIDNDLLNEYQLFYDTTDNYTKTKFTQSTIEFSIDENEENYNIYIYLYKNNDYLQVLTINFMSFCPVETVSVQVYQQDYIDNPQPSIYNDEISITSYGVINSLNLTYKDGYTDCTYKIFDENGLEIDDFTTIKNTTYTIKIYSDNTEIYSFLFKVKYQFNNLIDGMQYIGDANVASIVTNNSQLNVPNLTDTKYFTNQSIMFNGSNSATLTEGQQTIEVVYSFTVNQKTYNYTFDLIVEYVLQEDNPIDYVSGITINYTDIWGYSYQVSFDYNLHYSNGEYKLSDIAFVEENDILIDTYGYTVVSKEIKFSKDKTLCWLEYVISVDGQNKTFRAYIKTSGTISNNTNAQIIFSDAKTEEDITNLLIDDTYTIEKVNVFGDLEIILEDENARVEYYFGGEPIDRYSFALNSIGTYTVKIFSSDNTATRSINIIVQDYENLMFEAFYESERLYLEYSNNGPIGNMKMKYDPLIGPYFIGYFGEKDLGDLTQVTISGNSAYADMLYYSDKETPITNLDNLVLDLMTDLDGSITEIIGAKYVLVYAKIEGMDFAVYFIFEDRPPYPMTFSFDTDNNDVINENDKQISLKVNLEQIDTGIVDLGDFYIGESGPSVEVTREELGMAETATTVSATVNWLSTFEDYSYQYFTDLPEGQDMPELIGPSEDNMVSTIILNFADNGSGQYVATIYVCSEGATQETLMYVPVTFILVD